MWCFQCFVMLCFVVNLLPPDNKFYSTGKIIIIFFYLSARCFLSQTIHRTKKESKVMCECVCMFLSKYFLYVSLLVQIVKTHTHTPRTPTRKTGTNGILCVCYNSSNSIYMYTFSNLFSHHHSNKK